MKLRFSIRDLFWLALVVALGMGWWLDHRPRSLDEGRFTFWFYPGGTLQRIEDRQTKESWQRDNKGVWIDVRKW
jgi:hypothetical protein